MHDSVVAGARRALVRKAAPVPQDGRTNRKQLRAALRAAGILKGARRWGGGLR